MRDVVPLNENGALLFLLSFLLMVAFAGLSTSRRTALGPQSDRHFNRATLTLGMLLATITLCGALATDKLNWYPTKACRILFNSLQVMLANSDIVELRNEGLTPDVFETCVLYEHVVYMLAPISSILTVLDLLADIMTPIRMRFRSFNRKTFLLTPLNERTLALASSIREHEPKSCLIFAGASMGLDSAYSQGAREIDALRSYESVERVLDKLFKNKPLCIVFDGEDGAENITRASEILRMSQGDNRWRRHIDVFAVTSLYGSDTLPLESDAQDEQLTIHRIDWTRNLVVSTLERYPLFLRGTYPTTGSPTRGRVVPHLVWQKQMYADPSRHVVIVGAGHVGTEFLRLALSYSKIYGLSFRFDVYDNVVDPMDNGRCVAERVMTTTLPELFDTKKLNEDDGMRTKVTFHLCDARSTEFMEAIERDAETITYVFVSLGEDVACAETALRVREALERSLTQRCRGLDDMEIHRSYVTADRPVIVAVIDNAEVAKSLRHKNRQGRDRGINVVGLPEDMYGFEQMSLGKSGKTAYENRSTVASESHAKSRLFAYARSDAGQKRGMRLLPVNWEANLREPASSHDAATLDAIESYNRYCDETPALQRQGADSHEWLLRMEHSRWNTYMRAEGYRLADLEDIPIYYASALWHDSPHRSDLALLHPCLVPFDDLPRVDEEIDRIRQSAGLEKRMVSFQLQNDEHIKIEIPNDAP